MRLDFLGFAFGLALLGVSHSLGGEIKEVRKIWCAAPHNAFTDVARHNERWICVFREGKTHVSPDGIIRVLGSAEGRDWKSLAALSDAKADLRDPKICVTPDGRWMLTAAAAPHPPSSVKHQTKVWFSKDGMAWGEPVAIGEPNIWLWRVAWHKGKAYGIGYETTGERFVRLYESDDGRGFKPVVPTLFNEGEANEAAMVFGADDAGYILLRRDGSPATGKLGVARPPYREWQWKDLGVRIGGPQALMLGDGRVVAAVRLYEPKARTALCWLDVEEGRLSEFASLPSGGDTSYAGLAWHEDLLWVSYYSSHEGKASIYLATVRLKPGTPK